jgi:uncharacterized protein (DUF2267 family)
VACRPRVLEQNQYRGSEVEQDSDDGVYDQYMMKVEYNQGDQRQGDQYISMAVFKKLREQLSCGLCTEIYQNPQKVKQCLHQFCQNCIDVYNRQL